MLYILIFLRVITKLIFQNLVSSCKKSLFELVRKVVNVFIPHYTYEMSDIVR